jgi:aspartate carbamoyltransferase catalytic subunit
MIKIMTFQGKHILAVEQFTRKEIERILDVAEMMRPFAFGQKITKVLDGAVLANLFFEPSTRTRVSFGVAFNRLGGYVRETVGSAGSSITKGESIADTARVISGYSDVVTIRHQQKGTVAEFAKYSLVPVINGGDGPGEHPTQALLDLYTLRRELGDLENSTVAMVGDLKYGRTVHSLAKLLALYYNNITFNFVACSEIQMPEEIKQYILSQNKNHKINISTDLKAGISSADVIYATRIQEERFSSPEVYAQFRGKYAINKKMLQDCCKKEVLLLHPLPRDSRPGANELATDLDGLKNLAVFRQAYNGLPLRMALFALVLGVENKVAKTARNAEWYSSKKI